MSFYVNSKMLRTMMTSQIFEMQSFLFTAPSYDVEEQYGSPLPLRATKVSGMYSVEKFCNTK